jgi:hypothetical protein
MLGLVGLFGILLGLSWAGSRRAHTVGSRILGWVLVAGSALLILIAPGPPSAVAPPPCLRVEGCVRLPHTGQVLHPR